ncbi:MAG: peptide deformylase [Proteobacteria bacterium]|nr:peptide deformylase [Pseudomonadota bacterium]
MPALPILEAPHPILSRKARAVEPHEFNSDLEQFLQDMTDTMYLAPGVGLAAPQVGDGRRILVVDPGNNDDDAPPQLYQLVNPIVIEKSSELIQYDESCLSVPEYSLIMNRSQQIRISWQDATGKKYDQWFEDFPAIVIQHELDHLEGKTLLDHSSRFARNRYIKKRKKRKKRM